MKNSNCDTDSCRSAGRAGRPDYRALFDLLLGLLCAADPFYRPERGFDSPEAPEWVRGLAQIAAAPIWDDERAAQIIADWSARLVEMLEDEGCTPAQLNAARQRALAELRGETDADR